MSEERTCRTCKRFTGTTRLEEVPPTCPDCLASGGRPYWISSPPKAPTTAPADPLKVQVGGDHYKGMAIQPIEFSMANRLNACQHSIIKYVCRAGSKGGKAGAKQDLDKARHFIDLFQSTLEKEYADANPD